MNLDTKEVLAEFGIDVNGPDPAGQYQWKMLSLRAGTPERQRLEKAWSAFVLDRKEVDLTAHPAPTVPPVHATPASASAMRGKEKAPPVPSTEAKSASTATGWTAKRWLAIACAVIVAALLWLFLHDRNEHRPDANTSATEKGMDTTNEWRTKYEAIKTMLDTSTHDDQHHDEFILLAEAAKSAIAGGQAATMLERINADLAAERGGNGPQRIAELAEHTAQWKVIVEALVMNKAELLDHENFQGHHDGEL